MARTIMRNLLLASILACSLFFPVLAESNYPVLPVTVHAAPIPAPDIVYLDASDAAVSLKDVKGKLVVLHFWATWCVPCVKELPQIETLATLNKDVIVLPLSLDGKKNKDKITAFFKDHRIEALPVLRDDQNSAFRAVTGKVLPTTIFIKNNQEIARVNGPVDWKSKETGEFIKKNIISP